jgi:hypothetical protein
LVKTAHQHLLLLVGFDTLIYRKYYDTPPILVGHQKAAQEAYNEKKRQRIAEGKRRREAEEERRKQNREAERERKKERAA